MNVLLPATLHACHENCDRGDVWLRIHVTFRSPAVNRLMNSSAFSATSRQPASNSVRVPAA